MRYIVFGAVVLSVAISVSGCGRCGEKAGEKTVARALEKATGGKAKVDIGTVDLSSLPEFLRYPNAVALGKWEISNEKGTGTNWSFETPEPVSNVVTFYKNALSHWKRAITSETPELTTMVFGSPDEKEMVIIAVGKAKEGGRTTLNISHFKK